MQVLEIFSGAASFRKFFSAFTLEVKYFYEWNWEQRYL